MIESQEAFRGACSGKLGHVTDKEAEVMMVIKVGTNRTKTSLRRCSSPYFLILHVIMIMITIIIWLLPLLLRENEMLEGAIIRLVEAGQDSTVALCFSGGRIA